MRFFDALVAAVPYKANIVLTENGIQFADLPKNRSGRPLCGAVHLFDQAARPKHPWTNGEVERMNRTIREATVKRFHDHDLAQLRAISKALVAAYHFSRRLKTRKGLTPYGFLDSIH